MDQPIPSELEPNIDPQPEVKIVPNAMPTPPSMPSQSPDKLPNKFTPVIVIAGAIFLGGLIYYLIQTFTRKENIPSITTVVVTPTPSPTPIRYPTNVSTTSGFIAIEEGMASFSATLAEFSKDDPALSPPNLVLPLGL